MTLTAVATPTSSAEEDKLEMLRINIRHWRKDKGLAFRFMPASYWDEAITLARLLNVRRVACVLGLNVEELKRRVEGRHAPGAHTTVTAPPADPPDGDTPGVITPRVCDLPDIALKRPAATTAGASSPEGGKIPTECQSTASQPPERVGRPAREASCAPSTIDEAVLEVTRADGAKLCVRMPVGSFNVSSLIHDFRSQA